MICNCVHENTLYDAKKNINQIISNLSNDIGTLIKWFYDNYMVINPKKCDFMTLGFQVQNFDFHYETIVIKSSAEEKI